MSVFLVMCRTKLRWHIIHTVHYLHKKDKTRTAVYAAICFKMRPEITIELPLRPTTEMYSAVQIIVRF